MREIKFRAFIKNLEWMLPVERICFDCNTVEVDLTDGNGDTAEYDFDEVEVMQYTGLQDELGKDICEGDYVVYVLGGVAYTGIVVFQKGAFCIDWEKSAQYHRAELSYWHTKVSVTGNIFTTRSC